MTSGRYARGCQSRPTSEATRSPHPARQAQSHKPDLLAGGWNHRSHDAMTYGPRNVVAIHKEHVGQQGPKALLVDTSSWPGWQAKLWDYVGACGEAAIPSGLQRTGRLARGSAEAGRPRSPPSAHEKPVVAVADGRLPPGPCTGVCRSARLLLPPRETCRVTACSCASARSLLRGPGVHMQLARPLERRGNPRIAA